MVISLQELKEVIKGLSKYLMVFMKCWLKYRMEATFPRLGIIWW